MLASLLSARVVYKHASEQTTWVWRGFVRLGTLPVLDLQESRADRTLGRHLRTFARAPYKLPERIVNRSEETVRVADLVNRYGRSAR